jgi:RNA polymerase sigma-32 factor
MPTKQGSFAGPSLTLYLQELRLIPLLTKEAEASLHKDIAGANAQARTKARRRLFDSNLRFVVSRAVKYQRRYKQPLEDLISCGNIGLLKAITRFDPSENVSFTTFARKRIDGEIMDEIAKSFGIKSSKSKKVFFNFERTKKEILEEARAHGNTVSDHELAAQIASKLQVPKGVVIDLMPRMGKWDSSLSESPSNGEGMKQDYLVDPADNQEEVLSGRSDARFYHEKLEIALNTLPERERDIFKGRYLSDPPVVLEEFAQKYGVSWERVRQIGVEALEKVRIYLLYCKIDLQSLEGDSLVMVTDAKTGKYVVAKRPAPKITQPEIAIAA